MGSKEGFSHRFFIQVSSYNFLMDNLKKAILQDLESSGYLDSVRAEVRAKLFKAAEQHESKAEIQRPETAGILDSDLGQICAVLVKDFLSSFNLKYSLSVYVPETHLDDGRNDIEELEQMFQTRTEPGRPLLFSVIEHIMQTTAEEAKNSDRFSPGSRQRIPQQDIEEFDLISEDISQDESEPETSKRDNMVESHGTSSLAPDASVTSLAIDEYDYIEPVRRNKF